MINISVYSGLFSDSDAAKLTASVFDSSAVGAYSGGVTLTNQWRPAVSNAMTTETGSVNLTLEGTDVVTAEI